MQNAAARILTHMRQMPIQSVTPGLTELHWAPLLKKKIRLILKLQQLCAMWDCVCWSSVLWQAQKLAWQLFQIHLQLIYTRGTVGNRASCRQNSVLISTKQFYVISSGIIRRKRLQAHCPSDKNLHVSLRHRATD